MSNSTKILQAIDTRLAHIKVEPVSRLDVLEQYVRHSDVDKHPIAGGIRKDIYERLIDIEPENNESIAFFIRSTLGNISKEDRDPILEYLDSLHSFIDAHEDVLVGNGTIKTHKLTDDDVVALSLYGEVYELIGRQIEDSNFVYNELRRTYDGLEEDELQKIKRKLEKILDREELIYLKMSYFAPYLYYLYMKSTYSIDMTVDEINEWLDTIEDLFFNSSDLKGVNYSVAYVLDRL